MTNTSEPLRTIEVLSLTDNQPFCAGIVWVRDGKLAITLNPDGMPEELGEGVLRIGGVGGGQEPGESILECALREAREELGNKDVRLVSSDVTYFHDMDTGEIVQVRCTDSTAPFLLERMTSKHPDKPYRPGLPFGRYVYFCLYLGEAEEANINPDDDVAGVVFIPLEHGRLLLKEALTLGELLEAGAELLEAYAIPRHTRLWLPENESIQIVLRLLEGQSI
jgi:8-oxo-dGTP pyrophosphatase MutT (NUDIX family)